MTTRHLKPPTFQPLPLGAIRPEGWMRNQLRIQADGLSGHLDEFWPDIKDSQWFGGNAEGWERAPYWLDGFIPLAFLLDDPVLIERVHRHVGYILTHQHEDGWLGPKPEDPGRYDVWAQMLAVKMLSVYHDATGDVRVPLAIDHALAKLDDHIRRMTLYNWGQARWFETLITLYPRYEATQASWLFDLAVKLHAQGCDWTGFFENWPLTAPTPKGKWNFLGHVVNNAMAIKAPALWWRLSHNERDRIGAYRMINQLDEYHGMITGVFTGDECLAGRNPIQGTELCAVVEYMYSLEVLLSVLGDPALGDRLEKIAFNALPATFSSDMWAHQYDQQVNQALCAITPDHLYTTNGPESNLFGLEPNFGCCTANLSQGWPKFAAHLWMRTGDGGLAAVAYAPSTVRTQIGNAEVTVRLDTEYPFRDTLRFTVTTHSPIQFPLLFRIPGWAVGASMEAPEFSGTPAPGTFHRIDRVWSGEQEITLRLPMTATTSRRYNHAIAIERGPLVYALPVAETWKQVNQDNPHREKPHADWEVHPASPWSYALSVDENALEHDVTFSERPVGDCPFSPTGAPVVATVTGHRIPEWQVAHGAATATPPSPVRSFSPPETLTLIPYGCTHLRITELPTLEQPS
ncbi:MAG: glycoside hydrolase family 127 protein [candidate division Zixibacteria bacterium]|nr:glycoside hydrolase family 127 protein [candidate division Zixibacteria bacterium]